MKIKDFMLENFGKYLGNWIEQKKIVDQLELDLKKAQQKLKDIELYDMAKKAIVYCYIKYGLNDENYNNETTKEI